MRRPVPCAACLVLALGLALGGPRPAHAQADGVEAGEAAEASEANPAPVYVEPPIEKVDPAPINAHRKARRAAYPVGSRISRYLEATAETTDAGNTDEARALLQKLDLDRLNPYERALVLRVAAFVEYQAGEIEAAIQNFRKVLQEDILTVKEDTEIRISIAQLYASIEQWQKVIDGVNEWARYVPERTPDSHNLMAIAYYQLDNMEAAIHHAEQAVDMAPEPKEGWLTLLAALYVKAEDFTNAAPVLEELVMRFRKKEYWTQLSLIYGARDNFKGSLAVQQIAYQQGFLTEDKELRRLARGYLYNDLPYPAAEVLETGLREKKIERDAEAYELLANSWIAAREYDKSLEPLQRAAELAEDGNLYVRIGQVHIQREEWDEAVARLQQAIDKGGLKEPGNAHLLLGISLYNQQRIDGALASFGRAREHEDSRTQAEAWMGHIEKELQKAS